MEGYSHRRREINKGFDNQHFLGSRTQRCRGNEVPIKQNHRESKFAEFSNTKPEVKLPTFDGSSLRLDFLDWIDTFEDYFETVNLPEVVKCELVASKLKGEARIWWKDLQNHRFSEGKNLIASWPRMSKLLIKKFLHTSRLTYFYKQENENDEKHVNCSMKFPNQCSKQENEELVKYSMVDSFAHIQSSTECPLQSVGYKQCEKNLRNHPDELRRMGEVICEPIPEPMPLVLTCEDSKETVLEASATQFKDAEQTSLDKNVDHYMLEEPHGEIPVVQSPKPIDHRVDDVSEDRKDSSDVRKCDMHGENDQELVKLKLEHKLTPINEATSMRTLKLMNVPGITRELHMKSSNDWSISTTKNSTITHSRMVEQREHEELKDINAIFPKSALVDKPTILLVTKPYLSIVDLRTRILLSVGVSKMHIVLLLGECMVYKYLVLEGTLFLFDPGGSHIAQKSRNHIFGFPCILKYLMTGEDDNTIGYEKGCSLCFRMVSSNEWHTISIESVKQHSVGESIVFMLLAHKRESFVLSLRNSDSSNIDDQFKDMFSNFTFASVGMEQSNQPKPSTTKVSSWDLDEADVFLFDPGGCIRSSVGWRIKNYLLSCSKKFAGNISSTMIFTSRLDGVINKFVGFQEDYSIVKTRTQSGVTQSFSPLPINHITLGLFIPILYAGVVHDKVLIDMVLIRGSITTLEKELVLWSFLLRMVPLRDYIDEDATDCRSTSELSTHRLSTIVFDMAQETEWVTTLTNTSDKIHSYWLRQCLGNLLQKVHDKSFMCVDMDLSYNQANTLWANNLLSLTKAMGLVMTASLVHYMKHLRNIFINKWLHVLYQWLYIQHSLEEVTKMILSWAYLIHATLLVKEHKMFEHVDYDGNILLFMRKGHIPEYHNWKGHKPTLVSFSIGDKLLLVSRSERHVAVTIHENMDLGSELESDMIWMIWSFKGVYVSWCNLQTDTGLNLTRGRVILSGRWNDENNANIRRKIIMVEISVIIGAHLNTLCKNGQYRVSLRLFHKVVNGLDPPMDLVGAWEASRWIPTSSLVDELSSRGDGLM